MLSEQKSKCILSSFSYISFDGFVPCLHYCRLAKSCYLFPSGETSILSHGDQIYLIGFQIFHSCELHFNVAIFCQFFCCVVFFSYSLGVVAVLSVPCYRIPVSSLNSHSSTGDLI